MPRGPRIDAPGVVHHVTQRGVGRMDIFLDEADCVDFVQRCDRLIVEHGARCFGFVLMSNHFHFALQTSTRPLAELMQRLTTGYARYFNERHGHVGHVFQNRYGSRLIVDDGELATVLSYMARNPLEAHMVGSEEALRGYRWSSYPALMGASAPHRFVAVGAALKLFGCSPTEAREALRKQVVSGVKWAAAESDRRPPVTLNRDRAARFAALAGEACARRLVNLHEARSRCRRTDVLDARAEIAQRAAAEGFSGREIAAELRVSASAVCRLLRWGKRKGA